MAESATPRRLVQEFLQGAPASRPLFLPIIFAHGARVESVPLRAYLTNPTKISNGLRQIRGRIRADGVICYYDPLLEAEALGATIDWSSDDGPRSLRWPQPSDAGELPGALRSADEAAKSGRVAVAIDVIKRLKAMLRDECLLVAGVSGPYTLAAQLLQFSAGETRRAQDFSTSALDLAADAMTAVASAFLEAGASAVVIHEDALPVLSIDDASEWASRLGTTINIIRFYQALPVLLLSQASALAANREAIAQQSWDCAICAALEAPMPDAPERWGAALPLALFGSESSPPLAPEDLKSRFASLTGPVVVTTAGDVPAAADMEPLKKVWDTIRPR